MAVERTVGAHAIKLIATIRQRKNCYRFVFHIKFTFSCYTFFSVSLGCVFSSFFFLFGWHFSQGSSRSWPHLGARWRQSVRIVRIIATTMMFMCKSRRTFKHIVLLSFFAALLLFFLFGVWVCVCVYVFNQLRKSIFSLYACVVLVGMMDKMQNENTKKRLMRCMQSVNDEQYTTQ